MSNWMLIGSIRDFLKKCIHKSNIKRGFYKTWKILWRKKEESWENNTEFEKIILKENQHGCV